MISPFGASLFIRHGKYTAEEFRVCEYHELDQRHGQNEPSQQKQHSTAIRSAVEGLRFYRFR